MSQAPDCPHERLYLDHHGWLLRWLRRRLGCAHNAADLAQDTFLRVLARRDERTALDARQPRSYLRVIAHGLVVDHFRRRALEQAYLEALAALPEPVSISPEEREIILETLDRIDAMLERLPPKVRQAFLLSQVDGWAYDRIAERIGVSVRTVKRYMREAFEQCLTGML